MAKETSMAIPERIYNIPLRKEYLKSPKWRRTEKAVTALRKFLSRHMKTEEVRLGTELNELLWKHGIRNPPHHVKVTVSKDDKGVARAELFGVKTKEEVKKEREKKATEKKKESTGSKAAEKSEKKPEAKAKEVKK
ncbi:MAG: 50S ribosomal protein L31e [Nanoarchaeota archaeon]